MVGKDVVFKSLRQSVDSKEASRRKAKPVVNGKNTMRDRMQKEGGMLGERSRRQKDCGSRSATEAHYIRLVVKGLVRTNE